MKIPGYLLALILSLIATLPVEGQSPALLPLRDWSSTDGKTIRAELIGFEKEEAQLRFEDGRRVSVPEERFSAVDRAELLRARLLNLHWVKFSEGINTRFTNLFGSTKVGLRAKSPPTWRSVRIDSIWAS